MNKIKSVIVLAMLSLALILTSTGCAPLQPGADPVVVRAEQAEAAASSSFHLALQLDQLDRGFWRTNAPAFHGYCEWLRIPTPYQTTTILPRYRVLLLSFDDVKLDYKAGRATSNILFTAVTTLQSAASQAEAWLTIVSSTNQPPVTVP